LQFNDLYDKHSNTPPGVLSGEEMTRTVHFIDKECFINYFTKTKKKHHGSGKKSQRCVDVPIEVSNVSTSEQVKPTKAVSRPDDEDVFGDPFQSPMPSTSHKRKVLINIVSFTLFILILLYHLQSNDEREDKRAKCVLNRKAFMEEDKDSEEKDSDIEDSEEYD
jgi:hypothetical protein